MTVDGRASTRVAAVALLIALVVVCAVVAWTRGWVPGGGSLRDDGPLRVPFAHGYETTVGVGEEFTDGFEVLHNTGSEPLVIEEVALLDSDGIELLGAMVAPPPRRSAAVDVFDAWPPVDPKHFRAELVEAEGAVIPPSTGRNAAGHELLLGLRPTREGWIRRGGVRVVYRVGEERYEAEFPAEIALCTGEEYEVDGRCPFEEPAAS